MLEHASLVSLSEKRPRQPSVAHIVDGEVQPKLLRVLEDRTVQRLGSGARDGSRDERGSRVSAPARASPRRPSAAP